MNEEELDEAIDWRNAEVPRDDTQSCPSPSSVVHSSQSSIGDTNSTSDVNCVNDSAALASSTLPVCLLERLAAIVSHPTYAVQDSAHTTYLRYFNTSGFELYFKRLKQKGMIHCCIFIEKGSTTVQVLHSLQYFQGRVIGIVGFDDNLDIRQVDPRCLQTGTFYIRPFQDVVDETKKGDCQLQSILQERTRLDGFVRVCPVPIKLGLLLGYRKQNAKECMLACASDVITWNHKSLMDFFCGGSTLRDASDTVISIASIGKRLSHSPELLQQILSFYKAAEAHVGVASCFGSSFWDVWIPPPPALRILAKHHLLPDYLRVLYDDEATGPVCDNGSVSATSMGGEDEHVDSISSDEESVVSASYRRGHWRAPESEHHSDLDDDPLAAISMRKQKRKKKKPKACIAKNKATRSTVSEKALVVRPDAASLAKRAIARAKLVSRFKLKRFVQEMNNYQASHQSYQETFFSTLSLVDEKAVLKGNVKMPKSSIDYGLYMCKDPDTGELYSLKDLPLQGQYDYLRKQPIPLRLQAHDFLTWEPNASCSICNMRFGVDISVCCLSCNSRFHYHPDRLKGDSDDWICCGTQLPDSPSSTERHLCALCSMFIVQDDQHYILPQRNYPDTLKLGDSFHLPHAMGHASKASISKRMIELDCYAEGLPTPDEVKRLYVHHIFNRIGPIPGVGYIPGLPSDQVAWHDKYLELFRPIDQRWQRATTIGQIVFCRREVYQWMDGFRVVCVYSVNEDDQLAYTDLHVSYLWLRRFLPHHILGQVLLGESFMSFWEPESNVKCHANGWVDVTAYDIYYPFLKGVETKVGYFGDRGFFAQRTFRHHVFEVPLSVVEIEELPTYERLHMEHHPITCFNQVGRYGGSTAEVDSVDENSFSPPPNMSIPLKYQQLDHKLCAFCSIASAIYEHAIHFSPKQGAIVMRNVANGLFWLSRRCPPQAKYSLGTIVDFLRKHIQICVTRVVSNVNIYSPPAFTGDENDVEFHLCHLKNRYDQNHHVICIYQDHIFDSEHQHALPLSPHNLNVCGGNTENSGHAPIARCLSINMKVLSKKGRKKKRRRQAQQAKRTIRKNQQL